MCEGALCTMHNVSTQHALPLTHAVHPNTCRGGQLMIQSAMAPQHLSSTARACRRSAGGSARGCTQHSYSMFCRRLWKRPGRRNSSCGATPAGTTLAGDRPPARACTAWRNDKRLLVSRACNARPSPHVQPSDKSSLLYAAECLPGLKMLSPKSRIPGSMDAQSKRSARAAPQARCSAATRNSARLLSPGSTPH